MDSANAVGSSITSGVSDFESKIDAASERNIGWKSLAWLTFAAMAGLTASMTLQHLLFRHLALWQYRTMTISTGTVAVACCGYYLGRRFERLFSAHIQVEKDLAFERNLLRTVVDNIPDSILVKDSGGRYLLANKAFAKLHGFESPEPLLGKTVFDLFPKERAAALHAADLEVMRATKPLVIESERSVVDAEGNVEWILMTKVPLTNQQDEIVGVVGVNRNITRRKRAEAESREAKETAEAANRAKSEFLANMSHEIRTPLNGVVGMTDLALGTELTSEQREYLDTVKVSADSLLIVINDILDFSKIEAGKIDLEMMDFNIRDHLEATLKTLAVRGDEKGLELMCEVAPEVPEMVCGDSNRLRQIVVNLIGNAIKFTNEGEVTLKVRVDAEEASNRILHFTVSDTGVGIPPEKLKLIFEPFSQADTSTTRKYGGTGLGLTISARLVDMMGGTMWVESVVGRGSEFHFTARMGTSGKTVE